jgi:cellulose synthase (UDP-forming)
MMVMSPKDINKYLYVENTPTWKVRIVYITSIFAWLLVLYGYSGVLIYDPIYRLIVGPALAFFSLYYFVSYGVNLFYKQFDLKKHKSLIRSFWKNMTAEPSVDIFLPVCGEDIDILRNTWEHVSKIEYTNTKVYVLDDSPLQYEEHKVLAAQYGFIYFSRPDKGKMKKAGNLKYAYDRSDGEFILIFDADFAPRADFLIELLPYMDDPQVGIAQSPQYFEVTSRIHRRSPLEYGAARVQESFYRYIQVALSRFNGTICCGSNAIYRRAALEAIGGPVLVEHSEDARTGFALASKGWKILYIPVILAIGICPHDTHSYFHQQHRWASGSLTLCFSKKFWIAPVRWQTKLCYCAGFLFYLSQPIGILFSFQLFYFLFVYNSSISLDNGVLFYPAMFWGYFVYFFFSVTRFRSGVFLTSVIQTYSYSHAVISAFLKSTVGWLPTNTKHAGVSIAFKQVTLAVYSYIFLYLVMVAIAFRMNFIHLLNYNYYSVQFWIIYNLSISSVVLWYFYQEMEGARSRQVMSGELSREAFVTWRLKTLGLNVALLFIAFIGIVYT